MLGEQYTFRSMGCDIVVAGASESEREAIERLFGARESDLQPLSRRQRTQSRQRRCWKAGSRLAGVRGDARRLRSRPRGRLAVSSFPLLAPSLKPPGTTTTSRRLSGTRGRCRRLSRGGVRRCAWRGESSSPRWRATRPQWRRQRANGRRRAALLGGDGFVSAGGDLATRGDSSSQRFRAAER